MRLDEVFALTSGAVDPTLFDRLLERIDPRWISDALECRGDVPVRRRKLPAEVVIWTVVGACLYGERSFTDIIRDFGLTALSPRKMRQPPATSGAFARARAKLGFEVFRDLALKAAWRWATDPSIGDHLFRGLRVLAFDGTTFDLHDTSDNEAAFGRPSVVPGSTSAAFPKARAVILMDTRTHLMLDAEIAPYASSELGLLGTGDAGSLLSRIPDQSVTIFDRNFQSWGMLHRLARAGADRHWILRARSNLAAQPVRELGPGDRLVRLVLRSKESRSDPSLPQEMEAREITYHRGRTEIRVLTSLVDPKRYPAAEVAALYGERWEIEIALDDLKTEQRQSAPALRSRTAIGVRQEFFALMLAHNLVRFEAARAAAQIRVPPTRISFHAVLRRIAHHLHHCSVTTAPSRIGEWEAQLLSALAAMVLPPRRHRSYPRALKRIIARYPRKRIGAPQEPP